jgi:hypothetical protein
MKIKIITVKQEKLIDVLNKLFTSTNLPTNFDHFKFKGDDVNKLSESIYHWFYIRNTDNKDEDIIISLIKNINDNISLRIENYYSVNQYFVEQNCEEISNEEFIEYCIKNYNKDKKRELTYENLYNRLCDFLFNVYEIKFEDIKELLNEFDFKK